MNMTSTPVYPMPVLSIPLYLKYTYKNIGHNATVTYADFNCNPITHFAPYYETHSADNPRNNWNSKHISTYCTQPQQRKYHKFIRRFMCITEYFIIVYLLYGKSKKEVSIYQPGRRSNLTRVNPLFFVVSITTTGRLHSHTFALTLQFVCTGVSICFRPDSAFLSVSYP